jgi:hypothetical protein
VCLCCGCLFTSNAPWRFWSAPIKMFRQGPFTIRIPVSATLYTGSVYLREITIKQVLTAFPKRIFNPVAVVIMQVSTCSMIEVVLVSFDCISFHYYILPAIHSVVDSPSQRPSQPLVLLQQLINLLQLQVLRVFSFYKALYRRRRLLQVLQCSHCSYSLFIRLW